MDTFAEDGVSHLGLKQLGAVRSLSRSAEPASEKDRLASFARAIDQVRSDVEATLGDVDVAHLRTLTALSTALEITGRGLVHFSLEPFAFGTGVLALSAHKALELMAIGHTTLHGAYDRLPVSEAYKANAFRWRAPIDESSWRSAHNVRHHQYTNIARRDPDLDFGGLRLSARIPYRGIHRLQPFTNFASWGGFALAINLHVTGMIDVYLGDRRADTSARSRAILDAHVAFLRKTVPYYAREFLLFPALAGPMCWKTCLGNALSEVVRDVCAGAIIYCGHVGARDFPEETRAHGKGAFYSMQVEAACNTQVHPIVSVLCGGLDRQIEHHLFPRLPPNRLREIAPRVRAICEDHRVRYRSAPWQQRLREMTRKLASLSRREVSGSLDRAA